MNCIIVDDDLASRKILETLLPLTPNLELISSCESAIDAVQVLQDEPIDLIFLDINMPEMSGLELIESLRERPQVIMITGDETFAADAFKLDVTDYIVKPIEKSRYLQAVDKAQSRFRQQSGSVDIKDYIFVKKDGVILKVLLREIINIEAMADYVVIHTPKAKFYALSTMHGIESRLPSKEFIRVHRSHIISLSKLDCIEEGTAILDGKMIPIGNTYKQRLYRAINVI